MALARGGLDSAFDVMVDRYRRPLLGYVARIVGMDEAEDIVQRAFMKAFTVLRSDDRRAITLAPWLYRIAFNLALNARARRGFTHEQLVEHARGDPPLHEVLEQRERFRVLIGGLRQLPERQRAALVAHELEGRSYRDVAARLGSSQIAVRGLITRARASLRQAA